MPAQLLTYRCPHCQHTVELDAALAEHTVACSNPECGKLFQPEVPTAQPLPALVVPPDIRERPGRGPEPVRPAAPETEARAEEPAEKELFSVRPMMVRRYPFRCAGYVLAVVAGLTGVVLWWLEGWAALGVLGALLGLVAGFRLLSWALRNRNTSLTATNKRLLLRAGSLTTHSTEIPYKEIVDVRVHQSLLNRLMRVGDITFFTSMVDKQQIRILGVPEPEELAGKIRELHQP
jgi:membrane protein YdbS with pleckstrin-like domain